MAEGDDVESKDGCRDKLGKSLCSIDGRIDENEVGSIEGLKDCTIVGLNDDDKDGSKLG